MNIRKYWLNSAKGVSKSVIEKCLLHVIHEMRNNIDQFFLYMC